MNEETKARADHYREQVGRVIEDFFSQGNLALAVELYAAEYVRHDPATPDITGGLDGARAVCARYRTAFPDLRLAQADLLADGDKAVVRWSAQGTHRGRLQDIEPTGKKMDITGLTVFRFADGKIAEEWTNWDTLGMLKQLGVIPS